MMLPAEKLASYAGLLGRAALRWIKWPSRRCRRRYSATTVATALRARDAAPTTPDPPARFTASWSWSCPCRERCLEVRPARTLRRARR